MLDARKYDSWIVPIELARKLLEKGFGGSLFLAYYDDGNVHLWGESESLTAGEWRSEQFELDIEEFFLYENENYNSRIIPAPTYDQAFEWLRSKEIYGEIVKIPNHKAWLYTVIDGRKVEDEIAFSGEGEDYEAVRLDCLTKCLELL